MSSLRSVPAAAAVLLYAVLVSADDFSLVYTPSRASTLKICEHDKAWATSTLKGPAKDPGMYHADKIVDGDLKTAWVEGAPGPGAGAQLVFEIPTPGYSATTLKDGARTFIIHNGLAASKKLFLANNRIKDCRLDVFAGVDDGVYVDYCSKYTLKIFSSRELTLKDTMDPQRIPLRIDHAAAKKLWRSTRDGIRAKGGAVAGGEYGLYLFGVLTVKSVYKGDKYDDTCVSEIGFE